MTASGATVFTGPVYRYKEGDRQLGPLAEVLGRPLVPQRLRQQQRQARAAARPATDQDGSPADLRGQLPRLLPWGANYMDSKFGPDGALYVQVYEGFFSTGSERRPVPLHLHRRRRHPGPDPQWQSTATARRGRSSRSAPPAASPTSGTSATARRPRRSANPTHTYAATGTYTAKLTVTYADGEKAQQDGRA